MLFGLGACSGERYEASDNIVVDPPGLAEDEVEVARGTVGTRRGYSLSSRPASRILNQPWRGPAAGRTEKNPRRSPPGVPSDPPQRRHSFARDQSRENGIADGRRRGAPLRTAKAPVRVTAWECSERSRATARWAIDPHQVPAVFRRPARSPRHQSHSGHVRAKRRGCVGPRDKGRTHSLSVIRVRRRQTVMENPKLAPR